MLLWPGQKFVVTRVAYTEGGYTFIDMREAPRDMIVFRLSGRGSRGARKEPRRVNM